MLGVNRRLAYAGRAIALILCAFLVAPSQRTAESKELGNILFGAAEKPSREASATALEAVGFAIKAFELRERNQGDNFDLLQKSAGQLESAAKQMEAILNSSGDPALKDYLDRSVNVDEIIIEQQDKNFYAFWLRRSNAASAKSCRDAFLYFIRGTRQLSKVISDAVEKKDPQIFRTVSNEIGIYLRAGDLVSRIMQAK